MIKVSDVKQKILEKNESYRDVLTYEMTKDILFELYAEDVVSIHSRVRNNCLIGDAEYDAGVLKQKIIGRNGTMRIEEVRDTLMETETGGEIMPVEAFNFLVENDPEIFVYLVKSNVVCAGLICVGDKKPLLATSYYPPTKDIDLIAQASEAEKMRLIGNLK